jgi:gentisate 1,2-dioxygenase
MRLGDFVITSSWTWHDHSYVGKGPMVWLDKHMIKLLEASFRKGSGSDAASEVTWPEGDSEARHGANLLTIDDSYCGPTSPVFNYRYDKTREVLADMRRKNDWYAWHWPKLQYANPKNGDYAIPTIANFIKLLPKGFNTAPYRSAASTVLVCIEGSGKSVIGEGEGAHTFSWARAIFSWCLAGSSCATRRRSATPCCSAIPTTMCTKSSASSS